MATQSKTPNTRNKKDMKSRAEAASIASSKEFLRLKSAESQKVYEKYLEGVKSNLSPEQNIVAIQDLLVSGFELGTDIATALAPVLYERCSSGWFQHTLIDATLFELSEEGPTDQLSVTEVPTIAITLNDYQHFADFCHALPEFSRRCKTLLLALITFYRYNYHPSNWVRYDRKNIFYLAGLHTKSASTQETLTQYLHKNCGLNMRVVGSNQPIVCYDFSWIHDQPPIGDANPLLNFGPMTPVTLRSVIDKIDQAPDAQPPAPF